jgi:hypothetical protein
MPQRLALGTEGTEGQSARKRMVEGALPDAQGQLHRLVSSHRVIPAKAGISVCRAQGSP